MPIGRSATWFDFSAHFDGAPVQAVLSTREGGAGASSLDAQRYLLAADLGLAPERLAVPRQVHGAKVASAIAGHVHSEVDGLFSDDPHVVLTLQVADCAAVYLFHPESGYRGLLHAGWRGLAAGILGEGVGWLNSRGVDSQGMRAFIGPTIEMGHYEVGPEVVAKFPPAVWQPNGKGRYQLDLAAAARAQLAAGGVPERAIEAAGVCTHHDPLCHSYRRDGAGAGRMVAFFYQDA